MSNIETNIASARLRIKEVLRIVNQVNEDLKETGLVAEELEAAAANLAAAKRKIKNTLNAHGKHH